jgi:hypothetical protein
MELAQALPPPPQSKSDGAAFLKNNNIFFAKPTHKYPWQLI